MEKKLHLANHYLFVFTVVFVLLSFFVVTESNAQTTITGSFVGKVVDADTEQPIENVVVRFTNIDTEFTVFNRADSKGQFSSSGLLPGNYEIEISAIYYKT